MRDTKNASDKIGCTDFPCADIDKNRHILLSREIDAERIRVLMIREAPPNAKADYSSAGNSLCYRQLRRPLEMPEYRRAVSSYTPAGKDFLIEESRRKTVAEDIAEACGNG